MRNLKLTLAYDGSEFHGWQVQPGRSTVQGVLAEAVTRITGEAVLPQGSGRTDTGVHALAQVATLSLNSRIPRENFRNALNHRLPAAIRILDVTEVDSNFHARKSAKEKTYQYRIFRGGICPPFLARYVFHYPYPLDEKAMSDAAAQVEGEHDFTSFAAVDPERPPLRQVSNGWLEKRSNIRTVFASKWECSPEFIVNNTKVAYPPCPGAGGELIYTIRGSGFLHHMVRNLVGCFLLVGRKRLSGEDLKEILQARSRAKNPGATAPGSGLYLISVNY
jgi:tRNA pseudouridine38-40 synthase